MWPVLQPQGPDKSCTLLSRSSEPGGKPPSALPHSNMFPFPGNVACCVLLHPEWSPARRRLLLLSCVLCAFAEGSLAQAARKEDQSQRASHPGSLQELSRLHVPCSGAGVGPRPDSAPGDQDSDLGSGSCCLFNLRKIT